MRNALGWIGLLFAALLFGNGCATMIVDRSQVSYVGGDVTPQLLRSEGVGMLPVVAGQGQEAYRRPMGDQMTLAVASAMGESTFFDWRQTMEALNAADLSDTYQRLITTYREREGGDDNSYDD